MRAGCYIQCVAKKKQRYRIRNWHDYNKALVRRGSLTLWIDHHALAAWINADPPHGRGRPCTYSDLAITCMLMLRAVYHLPLRATQGLAASVIQLLQLTVKVPHYSTLSRRAAHLKVPLPSSKPGAGLHLVVDATGMKIYGEGEWRVRQHGWSKRRAWKKLHLGVDEQSGIVMACEMSLRRKTDGRVLPCLLRQVEGAIRQVSADGAYDSQECYRAIGKRGARAIIPPRKGSTISGEEGLEQRDENVRGIRRLGRKGWKRASGYHRRSLAETTIYRIKTIFGDRLQARRTERQAGELRIRCMALNRMTELGMPDSYAA